MSGWRQAIPERHQRNPAPLRSWNRSAPAVDAHHTHRLIPRLLDDLFIKGAFVSTALVT